MAQPTKADIEIAVKGIEKINQAKKSVGILSTDINKLNKAASKDIFGKVRQGFQGLGFSTNNLNKLLDKSRKNLNKVSIGTDKYFETISNVLDNELRLNSAIKKTSKRS